MLPELGVAALCVALIASFWQGAGLFRRLSLQIHLRLSQIIFGCIAVSFAILINSFVHSDFSVESVARHSHTTKPLFYRIAGTWGNHEGSALLWAFFSALYGVWFLSIRTLEEEAVRVRASGVFGLVNAFTIFFVVAASNPFKRLTPPGLEGQGLNPLLQDVALAIHPPILYAGYVGFLVPFALACGALLERRIDQRIASTLLPWSFLALALLTLGVGLGSWWAYRELGWGGWWFWDPVENASLLPWFAGLGVVARGSGVASTRTPVAVCRHKRIGAVLFECLGGFSSEVGCIDFGPFLRCGPWSWSGHFFILCDARRFCSDTHIIRTGCTLATRSAGAAFRST